MGKRGGPSLHRFVMREAASTGGPKPVRKLPRGRCRFCQKEGALRPAPGGDGTVYWPRRHMLLGETCPGAFDEAEGSETQTGASGGAADQ